jgi:hypothetical protein
VNDAVANLMQDAPEPLLLSFTGDCQRGFVFALQQVQFVEFVSLGVGVHSTMILEPEAREAEGQTLGP